MPIGVWSTSSTRSTCPALDPLQPRGSPAWRSRCCTRRAGSQQHVARERGLARAATRRSRPQAPERQAQVDVLQVVQVAPMTSSAGAARAHRRGAAAAGGAAVREEAAGERVGQSPSGPRPCPAATTRPPRLPAPGPRSMTWSRAADRVLVVLDHHQRVALGLELLQRVEQDPVVARVQADGRLVEDVAHAAQVASRAAPRGGCAAPRRRRASAPTRSSVR